MYYKEIESEIVYIIADTHGDFSQILMKISDYDIKDCVFLHAGDFGAFKGSKTDLGELNIFLKERNISLYSIRGNHDDPSYFVEPNHLSNLFLLEDYSVLKINEKNILMVGGAISIDREHNKVLQEIYKHEKYWENEKFVFKEDKISEIINENNINIDIVITHSSPDFVFPYNSITNIPYSHGKLVENYSIGDRELKNDLNRERYNISRLYQRIKNKNLSHWFYGHFHISKEEEYSGVIFRCIDINEIFEMRLSE